MEYIYSRYIERLEGPLLGWLWAIEAHKKLGIPLPINLLVSIVIERMIGYPYWLVVF